MTSSWAILDVMLPEMDGFELCRPIRKESDIPLIMLTARGDVMDRVIGLELGADDYLPKPFEPRELVARLQTVLRRRPTVQAGAQRTDGRLKFEGLTVDPTTRSVQCLGVDVELTSTEFDFLHLLAREPGRVFHRDDILNQLRGRDAELYTRAVDLVVSRLRKKTGTAGRHQNPAQCRIRLGVAPRATRAVPWLSPVDCGIAALGMPWGIRCACGWWRCFWCWPWRWRSPSYLACKRP